MSVAFYIAIATTVWFIGGEIITAKGWKNPRYTLLNVISDLGVTDRHVDSFRFVPERVIYSPRHRLMNFVFVSTGLIYFFSMGFLVQTKPGLFTILTSVGLVMIGIFHGNDAQNQSRYLCWLHWLGAGLAVFGGNINFVLISRDLGFTVGIIWGIAGATLAAIAMNYKLGWSAIPQRLSVYTILGGAIALGAVIS